MKKAVVVTLLVVVAICTLFLFVKKDAGALSFEYKFKAGQVDNYKVAMDMTMEMPGMQSRFTSGPSSTTVNTNFVTTQKVLSVNNDGSAKVEMALKDFEMKVPGMPAGMMPKMPDEKVTLTLSKDGGIGGLQGLENMQSSGIDTKSLFSQMNSYQMPRKRINQGDSWETKVPMPYGGEMKITSKLVAQNVPIAGTTASKIMQTYEGKGDLSDKASKSSISPTSPEFKGEMSVKGHGVVYFSEVQGKLIESHTSTSAIIDMETPSGLRGAPANGKTQIKMDMKMHMTKIQ